MTKMIQDIVDRAVSTATEAALSWHPVSQVIWIPALSAADDPIGNFVVVYK